jgi:hypothetical protein
MRRASGGNQIRVARCEAAKEPAMRPISVPSRPLSSGPFGITMPQSPARSFLRALRRLAACTSLDAAAEAVRVPEALATPLSARSRRHLRTARVSWW